MLTSEPTENISDTVLNGLADLADRVTGGRFSDQIDNLQQNIDKSVGTE